MNPIERVIRKVDAFQQSRTSTGLLFAVVKKYGDDQGGYLAALLTYYGFLSIFPLLLISVTVLGIVLHSNPVLAHSLVNSALTQFPVLGNNLGRNIEALRRNNLLGLITGLLFLAYGSLGVSQAGVHAMAEVWNVPGVVRPGFVPRLGRSVAFLLILVVGVVGTSILAGMSAIGTQPLWLRVLEGTASLAINAGTFVAAFRALTPKSIPWRRLIPGSLLAALGWSLLQLLGGYLVAHQLHSLSQVYGTFAVVLGLISFIYLEAQLVIYAAEFNVVLARHLWPRSIVQPPLTTADKAVLKDIAEAGDRRPEQNVEVTFRD
jgi:YihY family inner membrane protein